MSFLKIDMNQNVRAKLLSAVAVCAHSAAAQVGAVPSNSPAVPDRYLLLRGGEAPDAVTLAQSDGVVVGDASCSCSQPFKGWTVRLPAKMGVALARESRVPCMAADQNTFIDDTVSPDGFTSQLDFLHQHMRSLDALGTSSSEGTRVRGDHQGQVCRLLDRFPGGETIPSTGQNSVCVLQDTSNSSTASLPVVEKAALFLKINTGALSGLATRPVLDSTRPNAPTTFGSDSPSRPPYTSDFGAPVPTDQPAFVAGVVGVTTNTKASWRAYADVELHVLGSFNEPVPGAVATGSFSPGGRYSCITQYGGTCRLSSELTRATFTVQSVDVEELPYGGHSKTVARITIYKP